MGRPSQGQFNRFIEGARKNVAQQVEGYFGAVREAVSTVKSFIDGFKTYLEGRHGRAAYFGRARAGDTATDMISRSEDQAYGIEAMRQDAKFLRGFQRDLEMGRYGDEASGYRTNAIYQRAKLYVDRLTGTANESFAQTMPEDTEFMWVLGGDNNCDDCPEIAAGSPYTPETLPSYPGDGSTQCLANCRCSLISSEGTGFRPPA